MENGALQSVSTKNEGRELIELAPRKVIFVCKAKNQKFVNIDNFLFKVTIFRTQLWRQNFYSKYSERRAFLWSNNWQFENFFKINKRTWKHGTQEQVPYRWVAINGSENIQTAKLVMSTIWRLVIWKMPNKKTDIL